MTNSDKKLRQALQIVNAAVQSIVDANDDKSLAVRAMQGDYIAKRLS